LARTADRGLRGISAFIVEKGTEGLSFGPCEKKMGWNAIPNRKVILENVRIPAGNLMSTEGSGFKIAMSELDGGRINIAACSMGGARTALQKASAYLNERVAFGRRLAEFQALQFRIADMATELEVAQTFLWRAASALESKDPNATVFCSMAKRYVTDAGFNIANDALQMFGGYGYLVDYGIEKIVRDLRVHQILEGTNEIMRVIIARSMLSGNAVMG
jgi:alkylation response protein AidB-like acyl-CoA dehydrogenase